MFKNIKNQNSKIKGFTLIEMLVSIGIFIILTIALTGIFVSSSRVQSRTLATQELMSQSSYVLEYMDRFLRMAKKDVSGSCTGTAGANYNPPESISNTITFLDYNNVCHQFVLENNQIKEKKFISGSWVSAEITSSKVKVNNLKFSVIGGSQPPTNTLQPKITILIDIESKSQIVDPVPKIKVQTTISQRHLDVQE